MTQSYTERLKSNFILKSTLFLMIMCPAIQYSPKLLTYLFRLPIPFEHPSELRWTADVSSLNEGVYYISIGRPRGTCSIKLGSNLIDSNVSPLSEVRSHLFLGGFIEVSADTHKKGELIDINCHSPGGFSFKMPHDPLISTPKAALFVHFSRILVDAISGTAASCVLLLMVILNFSALRLTLGRTFPILLFSVISVFYCVSLAQASRMLVDGLTATNIHISLRNAFAASFIYLYESQLKRKKIFSLILLFCALAYAYITFFSNFNSDRIYTFQFFMFPIFTFWVGLELHQRKDLSLYQRFLISTAYSWTLFQIVDYMNLIGATETFLAPSFVTVLALALIYFINKSLVLSEVKSERTLADLEKSMEVSSMATRIAHDIQSPILLLKVLANESELPNEFKKTLSSAISRVLETTEQLLKKARTISSQKSIFSSFEEPIRRVNIIDTLLEICSEKEALTKLRPHPNVRIERTFPKHHQAACLIQRNEFTRILSNLLDNAIESIDTTGTVTIAASINKDLCTITIRDTGRGIPEDQLHSIGKHRVSFGKKNGNGLGLFYAIQNLAQWQGTLDIKSKPGDGTLVTLTLPISA